jgi:uncharacterized protein (TIGR02996 family)
MTAPRPQVLAFLEAIKETPDDDTPRLILADWLRENGDEPRADFIALQCRLAQLIEDDPEYAVAKAQNDQLLHQHAINWLGPLRTLIHNWSFHRGLLTVQIDAARLRQAAREAARWSEAWGWVEMMHLGDRNRRRRVPDLPLFRHITGLGLWANQIGDDGLEALLSSSHLTRLTSLNLSSNQISTTGVTILAQSPVLGRLRELCLRQNVIDDVGVVVLAAALPDRLARLDLRGNVFQLAQARPLSPFHGLRHLIHLDLGGNHLHPRGVEALAAIPWVRLSQLSLDYTRLGDEGAKTLAQSPHLKGLSTLDLRRNNIGLEGALALARSPYLCGLSCLLLGGNRFSEGAAAALRAKFCKAVHFD